MDYIKHNLRRDFQVYTEANDISEKLISISFKNIGTADAFINGFPLKVGDPMVTFGNEVPHEDITTYSISFDGAGAKRVIAIKTRISASYIQTATKRCE
jgi:hypothetical protein